MYTHKYSRTCTHTFIYTNIYIHVYIHILLYSERARANVCIHTYTYTYTHMHAWPQQSAPMDAAFYPWLLMMLCCPEHDTLAVFRNMGHNMGIIIGVGLPSLMEALTQKDLVEVSLGHGYPVRQNLHLGACVCHRPFFRRPDLGEHLLCLQFALSVILL